MPSQSWGNSVGSNSGSTLTLAYDGFEISGSNARITNPRIIFYSKSGWSDSNNSITAQQSAVDDVQVHSGLLNGGTRTWNVTGTWTPIVYGSTTRVYFEAKVVGISFFNGDGATSYYSMAIDLPQRPYSPPPQATGFAASYADVNKANLSWNVAYTGLNGATPLLYQYIDRTETDWAAGTTVSGQLGWQPTSWQDTSLQDNRRYKYRHIGEGPGGWSPYSSDSAWLYTKPAAPSAVSAAKQLDNSIVVTATNAAPHATKWEFSDSADGTTWTVLTSTHTSATYTHAAPNQSVTHRYRVRAQTPDGKWSDYSVTSNVVQLQTPPNPPTWGSLLAAYDVTLPIVTPFTHNPIDTTAQTAYEMQWRASADNGATWTAWTLTGKVASTTSSRTWAANALPQNRLIEMQVRTWGAHATASGWSATATFRTSARPTLGISAPTQGQVLTSKWATVAWNYADAEGSAQSSWRVTLKTAAGVQLEQWSGSGAASSYALPYELADDTSYQVTVEVRDGVGLWSDPVTRPFSVNYLPPPPPTVEVQWDVSRGAAALSIYNPTPAGAEPPAVSNDVYRDGVLIATGVPTNSAFVDPLPLTTGSTYVVESVSALPSTAPSAPAVLPLDVNVYRRFWLNAGPGWTTVASFYGNVKRSRETRLTREVEQYSGRPFAVETIGEGQEDSFGFSTTVVQAEDSPASFHAVGAARGTLCFREPSGRYFVSIGPVQENTEQDITAQLSFNLRRVDFTEGML